MTSPHDKIAFRKATEDDFDFLYGLHVLAMKPWVEQTWGWNEADQLRFFRSEFDPSASRVIVVDGQDAGVLSLDTREDIFIRNIELLPQFQCHGLGARILRDILADAESHNQSVSLRVLKVNPAARLYARLGFAVYGETETHYLMRRDAHLSS